MLADTDRHANPKYSATPAGGGPGEEKLIEHDRWSIFSSRQATPGSHPRRDR